ncbi:hypothetical protein D1872_343200 [compost metagenome]
MSHADIAINNISDTVSKLIVPVFTRDAPTTIVMSAAKSSKTAIPITVYPSKV